MINREIANLKKDGDRSISKDEVFSRLEGLKEVFNEEFKKRATTNQMRREILDVEEKLEQ